MQLPQACAIRVEHALNAGEKQPAPTVARKWLWLSAGINVLLLILAGGAILFAFTLNYDLLDMRSQRDKALEDKQRVERYLDESRARAAEVEREIQRLSQALSGKAVDPAQVDSNKPLMPVKIRFRKSYLGMGLVAEIENTSHKHLVLLLTVRNPTLATARRFQIEVKPENDIAFGHDDGWRFASGDELGLYHNDYRAIRMTVP